MSSRIVLAFLVAVVVSAVVIEAIPLPYPNPSNLMLQTPSPQLAGSTPHGRHHAHHKGHYRKVPKNQVDKASANGKQERQLGDYVYEYDYIYEV